RTCCTTSLRAALQLWRCKGVNLLNFARRKNTIVDAHLIDDSVEWIVVSANPFTGAADDSICRGARSEPHRSETLPKHTIHVDLRLGASGHNRDVRPSVHRGCVLESYMVLSCGQIHLARTLRQSYIKAHTRWRILISFAKDGAPIAEVCRVDP